MAILRFQSNVSILGFLFYFPVTVISIEVEIEILRKQLVVEFDLGYDGSCMNMFYMKPEAATSEKKGNSFKNSHIFWVFYCKQSLK